MRCPGEMELDRAALRLLDLGLTRSEERGTHIPEELRAILEHAERCVRCRELLDLFLDTETRHRSNPGSSETRHPEGDLDSRRDPIPETDGDGRRFLTLRPLRINRRPPPSSDTDTEFEIAAETPRSPDHDSPTAGSRVLTLATDDHRYIVRIFPNEDGVGATAVLVGSERGLILRFRGVEYAFDESGTAGLPEFPGPEIELLLP